MTFRSLPPAFSRRLLASIIGLLGLMPYDAFPQDLSFPLEEWGLVAQWWVGSPVRSVREGWTNANFKDYSWAELKAGRWIPEAKEGIWLRNDFRFKEHLWREIIMPPIDAPQGTAIYINGKEVPFSPQEQKLSAYLQKGRNVIVLAYPPVGSNSVKVPRVVLEGVSSGSGHRTRLGALTAWRIRRERIRAAIPKSWLTSAHISSWLMKTAYPGIPSHTRHRGPFCLKAIMKFPPHWKRRRIALFLHNIPGRPAVYVNGVKVQENVECPSHVTLDRVLRHNGKDVLALMFDAGSLAEDETQGRWGIAALTLEEKLIHPSLPSGATIMAEHRLQACQKGVFRAEQFLSDILALADPPCKVSWIRRDGAPEHGNRPSGGALLSLLAVWPAPPYGAEQRLPAINVTRGWIPQLRPEGKIPIWLVTPPTAGQQAANTAKNRLMEYRHLLGSIAAEKGTRVVPFHDACRLALQRQRRTPTKLALTDEGIELTAHGSYLLALTLLESIAAHARAMETAGPFSAGLSRDRSAR